MHTYSDFYRKSCNFCEFSANFELRLGRFRGLTVPNGKYVGFLACLLFASEPGMAVAATPAHSCRLSPKQVVTRFLAEFYGKRQVRSSFERWVDSGYIQHNPFAASGREAAVQFLEPYFKAYPDIRNDIKRIVADRDIVVVHVFARINAEDRGSAVIDIFRVKRCKIVEHWDVMQPVPHKSANGNGMF